VFFFYLFLSSFSLFFFERSSPAEARVHAGPHSVRNHFRQTRGDPDFRPNVLPISPSPVLSLLSYASCCWDFFLLPPPGSTSLAFGFFSFIVKDTGSLLPNSLSLRLVLTPVLLDDASVVPLFLVKGTVPSPSLNPRLRTPRLFPLQVKSQHLLLSHLPSTRPFTPFICCSNIRSVSFRSHPLPDPRRPPHTMAQPLRLANPASQLLPVPRAGPLGPPPAIKAFCQELKRKSAMCCLCPLDRSPRLRKFLPIASASSRIHDWSITPALIQHGLKKFFWIFTGGTSYDPCAVHTRCLCQISVFVLNLLPFPTPPYSKLLCSIRHFE